jgi:hypothetical protein
MALLYSDTNILLPGNFFKSDGLLSKEDCPRYAGTLSFYKCTAMQMAMKEKEMTAM